MKRVIFCMVGLILWLTACAAPTPAPSPSPTVVPATITVLPSTSTPTTVFTETVTPEPSPVPPIRFAVIGDYGMDNSAEADVAAMIHGWNPDFMITVGDNNYPLGEAGTIDTNIGKYYHDYISPYIGAYGPGADTNRFFPTLGNHDWYTTDAQPYFDYFSLPGNERYYDFIWGPVHFFALDSDEHEPDGFNLGSVQAAWLKQGLEASTSFWNLVYMHYPPYSSGHHGSQAVVQWPYAAWGADVVLAGHDHLYERLLVDGIPYITNGAGGGGLYNFVETLPESRFRFNANYGAMLVTASEAELKFEFYSRTGILIDEYRVQKP